MYSCSVARTTFAFATLCLFTLSAKAHAQTTFITTNTTLNAANRIAGSACVGYANQNDLNNKTNPASPTVNLVSSGNVGGTSGDLFAYNSSTINVNGGSVGGYLIAYNNSTVNFTSGTIGRDLAANDSGSTVNMSGGSIGVSSLYAGHGGVVNLSGGSVGYLDAINNSTVNFSGGSVANTITVFDTATLYIFGTGLTAVLVNPGTPNMNFSLYSLSGILSDGTILTNKNLEVQNGTGARFVFNPVPEPGSMALIVGLSTLGASLARRKWARRNQ